ncbi:MAG: rhomboid family intramembrane serine protease [Opitutus sp.]
MLSDRPYMREDYQPERTSFLVWILAAIAAGFIVQNIFAVWLGSPVFERLMVLSAAAVKQGHVWALLTYPLLHGGILHLLLIGLGIFFLGREVVAHVGERRMPWLTLGAVALGGLAWLALNFNRMGVVMGAAPILLCYLTVFACLFPNREISFLVFFVIPITTRPKYILWVALAIDVLGLLFSELPGGRVQTTVAHSAHLGAMLAGWLYYRFMLQADSPGMRRSAGIELPRWMKRRKKMTPTASPAQQVRTAPGENIRAEVDRILDKINSQGFGSLTPEEKRVLDNAKDLLSRR